MSLEDDVVNQMLKDVTKYVKRLNKDGSVFIKPTDAAKIIEVYFDEKSDFVSIKTIFGSRGDFIFEVNIKKFNLTYRVTDTEISKEGLSNISGRITVGQLLTFIDCLFDSIGDSFAASVGMNMTGYL